ncbi:MAG: hypothetical protein HOV83_34915 [Catenulispora sp.]|nr:hypothetical protein [Catenulispora sp.]
MGESAAVPLVEPAAGGDDEPFLGLAWAEAIEATELLRSALAALGLAEEIPRLRGDVNVYGRPMVTVGRISPTAARRLAAALSRAAQQTRVYGQAPTVRGEVGGGCALPGAAPSALPGAVSGALPGGLPSALPGAVSSALPGGGLPSALPGGLPGTLAGPLAASTPSAMSLPTALPVAAALPGAAVMPGPTAAPRTSGVLPGSPSDSMRLPA